MGDYIGATHVEAYNPQRSPFTESSKPSLDQVNELISQSEAEVAAALSIGGYDAVPSSATISFKLVQGACAKCAAALVEQVAPNSTKERVAHYVKMCDSAKAMLADGNLPDLEPNSGGAGTVRSGFEGASPPFFTRDMEL